mmetsp:Transcript_76200/g.210266  ORF Transcript_76200/g.210266 Transcript_76200/m.210266 type:complete len:244 (+) Transcript_76200:776-1507(+)
MASANVRLSVWSLRFSASSWPNRSSRPCNSALRRRTSVSNPLMPLSSMAAVPSSFVASALPGGVCCGDRVGEPPLGFKVVSNTCNILPWAASRRSWAFSCCSLLSSSCKRRTCSLSSCNSLEATAPPAAPGAPARWAGKASPSSSRPVGSGGGGIFWQALATSSSLSTTEGWLGSSRASSACFAKAKMRSQRPPFINERVRGMVFVSMILARRCRPCAKSRLSKEKPFLITMSSRISAISAQE